MGAGSVRATAQALALVMVLELGEALGAKWGLVMALGSESTWAEAMGNSRAVEWATVMASM